MQKDNEMVKMRSKIGQTIVKTERTEPSGKKNLNEVLI